MSAAKRRFPSSTNSEKRRMIPCYMEYPEANNQLLCKQSKQYANLDNWK